MNETAIIIDCHNVGWSAAYSFGNLSHKGSPTGVLFGLFRSVLNAGKYLPDPDHIIFAWDSRKRRRSRIYPGYKIKRIQKILTEEEQIQKEQTMMQLNLIRGTILPELGLQNSFMATGYEADDIMASLPLQHNFKKVVVVTTDQDMYQILTDNVEIYNNSDLLTKKWFEEVYGITPNEWAEVKTLAGCTTDEVPGVERVGESTAIKHILTKLKPGQAFDNIEDFLDTDDYERNKKLVTLPLDQLDFDLVKCKVSISRFQKVCRKYNLRSFLMKKNLIKWERLLDMG